MQRLARGLAAQIPQRDVDRRGGAHLGAAARGADVAAQRARVALDSRRVLPEQVAGDRVDVRLDGVGEEERLAEPVTPSSVWTSTWTRLGNSSIRRVSIR